MEGLEITELNLSEVREENQTKRIDPEFFRKDAQKAYARLRHHRRFADLVKTGYRVIYESTEIIERAEGVPLGLPFFLQAADLETPFIHDESMACVAESDWERYPKGRIQPGEILIEVKGKAEKVAIVPDDFPRKTLVTGTCYKLQVQDPLDKHLLVSFLLCRYGQALKERLKTNLLISFISKDDLYSLPVPQFSDGLKRRISEAFVKSEEWQKDSIRLQAAAEYTLLKAMGLEGWHPPEPLTYTRCASEALAAQRIDSDFFAPARYATLEKLAAMPHRLLRECCNSVRELIDSSKSQGIAMVRNFDVTDALKPSLDDSKEIVDVGELGSTKKLMKPGDVVISRLRSYLRQIAVVRTSKSVPTVGSTEFIVLRPKKGISPELLQVFLRSQPVQTILKYCQEGNQHPRFGESNLLEIPFPEVLLEHSEEIITHIRQAHAARQQAQALLAKAKRAVEVAIEEGEEAALILLAGKS